MGATITTPTGNQLLDAMPEGDREQLLATSRPQSLTIGHVYLNQGDPVETVLFPTNGSVSVVTSPDIDGMVEAVTIGREGVANVHAALGSRKAGQELIGQIEGRLLMVDVDTFAKTVETSERVRAVIYGYIEAVFAQSALNTACNAIHHVNQRCARWLLAAHDRVDDDTFELKQEFLAIMLGVQRPTVSVAAGTLQASGSITYKRGMLTIVDREALEQSACACYEAIRGEYERLVPVAGPDSG
jgi:CRP-like cAMP-binding protein